MRTPLALTGAAAAVIAGAGALGVALARRVVMPSNPRAVRMVSTDGATLTLQATEQTTHPGTFGIWFHDHADRDGHAVIGEVLHQDLTAGTVTRRILSITYGDLTAVDRVRWTGHLYPDPTALHPDAHEVAVPVQGGTAPAWVIPTGQPNRGETWGIHVHGIRTTRITALRTVPAASQAGYTSLVISYRGDGEGPPVPNNASTLGQTEWHDIDAAITYALTHGADSVVLFGWSMGANPALLAAERTTHRATITGIVLIDPVTEWRGAIRAGATRAHLPPILGSLAAAFLQVAPLARIVGLPAPIDLGLLDWTRPGRITAPCLVIHSDGDSEIPITLSRRFAAAHPDQVDLAELPMAAHAWEYNLDPDTFNRTITTWLTRHVASRSQHQPK